MSRDTKIVDSSRPSLPGPLPFWEHSRHVCAFRTPPLWFDFMIFFRCFPRGRAIKKSQYFPIACARFRALLGVSNVYIHPLISTCLVCFVVVLWDSRSAFMSAGVTGATVPGLIALMSAGVVDATVPLVSYMSFESRRSHSILWCFQFIATRQPCGVKPYSRPRNQHDTMLEDSPVRS